MKTQQKPLGGATRTRRHPHPRPAYTVELPGAMRWVGRRVRLVHHVLRIVIGLLPERLARCVAEVGAVRMRLETDTALRVLRTLDAVRIVIPAPAGMTVGGVPVDAVRIVIPVSAGMTVDAQDAIPQISDSATADLATADPAPVRSAPVGSSSSAPNRLGRILSTLTASTRINPETATPPRPRRSSGALAR